MVCVRLRVRGRSRHSPGCPRPGAGPGRVRLCREFPGPSSRAGRPHGGCRQCAGHCHVRAPWHGQASVRGGALRAAMSGVLQRGIEVGLCDTEFRWWGRCGWRGPATVVAGSCTVTAGSLLPATIPLPTVLHCPSRSFYEWGAGVVWGECSPVAPRRDHRTAGLGPLPRTKCHRQSRAVDGFVFARDRRSHVRRPAFDAFFLSPCHLCVLVQ